MSYSVVGVASAALVVAAAGQTCIPQWQPVFVGNGPDAPVSAVDAVHTTIGGSLYIGGHFENVAAQPLSLVARWDGSWSGLGAGIPRPFNSRGFAGCCAHVLSITNAPQTGGVFVAGDFVMAGGQVVESITEYAGGQFAALAGGVSSVGCMDCSLRVYDAVVFNGQLHIVGGFDLAGGIPASNIARWDGQSWHALGTGLRSAPGDPMPAWAETLAVYEEQGVPRLFAAGRFSMAGAAETHCIARWDGQAWSAVGGGVEPNPLGAVPAAKALAVHDDGRGPALFVAGQFDGMVGLPARNIARWDGTSWSGIGDVGPGPNDMILALAVFNDGRGPALYAGGTFDQAGGIIVANIARWDGTFWEGLDTGVTGGRVASMAAFDDGSGPALFVGGDFTGTGGWPSEYLGKWSGCAACYANCDNSTAPPVLNVADFTCFLQRYAAGESYANCDNSTSPPVLNVADFTCFLQSYAAGCP